jgi:competence protein ComEA
MADQPDQQRSLKSRLLRRNARQRDTTSPGDLLTPSDQRVIAALVTMALVCMATSWLNRDGLSSGLVEIDQAPRLKAKFQTDVNAAEWTELMQLPEIGQSLARGIVESRERDGPFASHDDLDRVPGIGPKTLERIRPYLRPID